MLDATQPADGVVDFVEVYSAQRNDVVTKLQNGDPHVQSWNRIAAYDSGLGRMSRVAHKRAYFWMASEYRARMGHPLIAAPVWVGFDRENATQHHQLGPRRTVEKLLVLQVPRTEILISNYAPWESHILWGLCLEHNRDYFEFLERMKCRCTGRRRRESWREIFELPPTDTPLQGVMDRIKPEWLLDVIE